MFLSSSPSARVAALLAVALALAALHPASAYSQEMERASPPLAFTPVTVIDVREGVALPDRTVVIEGDRIAAEGPAGTVEIPRGARVVDGSGKYLIPGLWDMHAHATTEGRIGTFFPLLVANGVTGIRDPWGSLAVADSARAAVQSGDLTGPARIVAAGNLVDGPPGNWPGSQIARSPADGRRIVDSLHAAGVPFVKVYHSLSAPTYFAIAERARELDLPVVGHVPFTVRAAEASEAGQRSIEHLFGVLTGCSSDEEAILAGVENLGRLFASGGLDAVVDHFLEQSRRAVATQDEARCRRLAERFVENDTWQVPTLVSLRGKAYLQEIAAAGDPRTRYFEPPSRWLGEGPWPGISLSEGQWEVLRAQYEREREIVGLMAEAGVPILAGSDTATPWAFPGFGLHDELELLVEAGLTPLHALRAATLEPARFFGATDSLGTVEEGNLADLVLLEANPLEDITNTREIRAVVADGRYLDRAALDELLADAERAAGRQDAVRDSVSSKDRSPAVGLQEAEVPRTRTFSGLVAPAFPYAQPESVGVSSETLDRLGDEIADWTVGGWHYDQDLVGAELLVIKDGKAIFHEAYGWSDREASVPVERISIWSIKSMSKPVTTTAALILADEGKLSLDDPVSRYVPTFPDDRTTLRHLLAQTSGYAGGADPYLDRPSLRTAVEDWAAAGPSATRGEFYYSDFNTSALGYIVGAVSGTPIDRFTEERILEPLGLGDTSTGFSDDPTWRARLNPWYRWNEGAGQYDLRWATNREPWPFYPAAWGMFSTTMDYAEFVALWMNGGKWKGKRLLSEATVEEALRPHGRLDGHGLYGYGWFVDDLPPEDGRSFSHGGGDGTLAMAFPADSLIVVYMTHSRGGHHVRALINRIYMSDLVTHPGLDPEYFPLAWADEANVDTVGLTAEQQVPYVGTFRTEEEPATVAAVWEEAGRLHFRYRPEGVKADLRYDLVSVGADHFALGHYEDGGRLAVTVDPPYRVRFLMENGAVQALELRRSDEIVFRALPVSSSAQASGV